MRYDPDGNEKRRARKGEVTCKACRYRCAMRCCSFPYVKCHWDAGIYTYDRDQCLLCLEDRCRADDAACAHFVMRADR